MLVSDLIQQIRCMVNDKDVVEFPDDELIYLINDAIKYFSIYLIDLKDPEMIKEVIVSDGDTIPNDYYALAGIHPLEVVGNKFILFDPSTPKLTRYYAVRPSVVETTDEMPFRDIYMPMLSRIVAIYAQNRIELQLTQDFTLIQQIMEAAKGGKT